MDAIALLKADHKKVSQLFRQLEGQKGARKGQIGTRILNELEVHTQIEEEIFYPSIRELADEKAHDMVNEAYEEHRLAKDLISELKGREPAEDMYDAQFKVLRENIEHHVEEEENEMFPHIRPLMRDQLPELGARMQARKRELQKTSGSVTGALRGLMTRAYEAVAGPETPGRRSPKRSSRPAKKRNAARSAGRTRNAATKAKRAAAKTKSLKKSTRGRAVARAGRKRTATKSSAQAKRGQARRSTRRVAARKR